MVVRERLLFVLIVALLGLAVSVAYALTREPEYLAVATIQVSPADGQAASDYSSATTFTVMQAGNLSEAARTQVVLEGVAEELGLSEPLSSLSERVQATVQPDSSVITIDVRDSNPNSASAIANAIAAKLQESVPVLAPRDRSGAAAIQVKLLARAEPPRMRSDSTLSSSCFWVPPPPQS